MFGFRWEPVDFMRILARFAKSPKTVEPEPREDPPAQEGAYDITWVDLRDVKKPSRGKSKGQRPWGNITGITLHQTAVVITKPERCLGVPVHGCVLPGDGDRSAVIVLLHDPTDYMYHANGFNRRDIGIEVSARACGIEGDPRTLWLPKKHKGLDGDERLAMAAEATDGQLEACRRLQRYYCDMVSENGGGVEFIHAHRQATKNRVSDPGSRIWMACGEWAIENLGLKVGLPDFQISDGKPLPDAWTGRANGVRYNWRVDGRISPSDVTTES
jgi:hypothetical protein